MSPPGPLPPRQNNERDPNARLIPRRALPAWAAALIAGACLVAAGAVGAAVFLVIRERRGRPYFKAWQDPVVGAGLAGTL
jgi:hypothetical protein